MSTVKDHSPSLRRTPAPSRATIVAVARYGWFAKGIVYVLAGALASTIAVRSLGLRPTSGPNGEASPTGAIKELATFPGGRVLLVALAVGLVLYAAWRLYTAFAPGHTDAESMAKRTGYLVSAALYLSFGLTAIGLARTPSQRVDGDSKARDLSSGFLASTGGRWLLGVFGVVAVGAGVYRVMKGVQGDVLEEIRSSGMSKSRLRFVRSLGIVGEIGRGVAIALIGYFLVREAMTDRASEGAGLDDALRRVAVHGWGQALVSIVAVGFVVYGVFCLLTFNRRELRAP